MVQALSELVWHPRVAWSVELEGVRVVREDSGQVWDLRQTEAALFSLLVRGWRGDDLVQAVALIGDLRPEEAGRFVSRAIDAWQQDGIVVARARE